MHDSNTIWNLLISLLVHVYHNIYKNRSARQRLSYSVCLFAWSPDILKMTSSVKGILKGLRYISQIFEKEEEEEEEIQIGEPTDVKHVAHIGNEGQSKKEGKSEKEKEKGSKFKMKQKRHAHKSSKESIDPSAQETTGNPKPRRKKEHKS